MSLLAGWLPVHAAALEGAALRDLGARALGVGKAAAAASTVELLLREAPRGVLLLGVCGAFEGRGLDVGDLCVVDQDRFGDEGYVTADGFVDLAQAGLGEVGPFAADPVSTQVAQLLACRSFAGVTVSTCSSTDALAAAMAARSDAAVETMEGAAVAMVCARYSVPFVQVRAVSNRTGDRSRAGWDLERAVQVVQRAVRSVL